MVNTLSNFIKILKKNGKIESSTKIIYSPKYNSENNNYNTFCTFKSIDENILFSLCKRRKLYCFL